MCKATQYLDNELWFQEGYRTAGFKWSKALCEADSDGDGQTNGFELGDPNCCWNEGDTPKFSTELSHPGKSTSKSNRTATRRLGGGHDDHEHGDGKGTKNTCGTESSGYSLQPSFVQVVMVALLMLFQVMEYIFVNDDVIVDDVSGPLKS